MAAHCQYRFAGICGLGRIPALAGLFVGENLEEILPHTPFRPFYTPSKRFGGELFGGIPTEGFAAGAVGDKSRPSWHWHHRRGRRAEAPFPPGPQKGSLAVKAGAAQENNAGKLPLLGDRGVIPPCQPCRVAAGFLALPANPGFSGGNQFCPRDLDEESEKEGGSNLLV